MTVRTRLRQARPGRALLAASLLTGAALLSACSTAGDYLPAAVGGLPEGTPQRPAAPAAYPAVHDMPPKREDTMLSYEEQKKLEDDLIAARKRAAGAPSADAPKSSSANSTTKPAGSSGN